MMYTLKWLILIGLLYASNALLAMDALRIKQDSVAKKESKDLTIKPVDQKAGQSNSNQLIAQSGKEEKTSTKPVVDDKTKPNTEFDTSPKTRETITLDEINSLSKQGLAALFEIPADTFKSQESLSNALKSDSNQKAYKKTYFILALRIHPDKNPDNIASAEEAFKKISNFYDLLKEKKVDKLQDETQSASSEDYTAAYKTYADFEKAYADFEKKFDDYLKANDEFKKASDDYGNELKKAQQDISDMLAQLDKMEQEQILKNERLAKKPALPTMSEQEIQNKISILNNIKFENNKLIDTKLDLNITGDPALYIALLGELKKLKIANDSGYQQFITWIHTQRAKSVISTELHNMLAPYPYLYWYVTETKNKTISTEPLFMIWHMIDNKNI